MDSIFKGVEIVYIFIPYYHKVHAITKTIDV